MTLCFQRLNIGVSDPPYFRLQGAMMKSRFELRSPFSLLLLGLAATSLAGSALAGLWPALQASGASVREALSYE